MLIGRLGVLSGGPWPVWSPAPQQQIKHEITKNCTHTNITNQCWRNDNQISNAVKTSTTIVSVKHRPLKTQIQGTRWFVYFVLVLCLDHDSLVQSVGRILGSLFPGSLFSIYIYIYIFMLTYIHMYWDPIIMRQNIYSYTKHCLTFEKYLVRGVTFNVF